MRNYWLEKMHAESLVGQWVYFDTQGFTPDECMKCVTVFPNIFKPTQAVHCGPTNTWLVFSDDGENLFGIEGIKLKTVPESFAP